jgi:hypothetical protein
MTTTDVEAGTASINLQAAFDALAAHDVLMPEDFLGDAVDVVAPQSYRRTMSSVVKKSISVPDDVWAAAEAAAKDEHTTVSALVSEALTRWLAVRSSLRSVQEWELEHGAFTAEELAEADALLAGAGVTAV